MGGRSVYGYIERFLRTSCKVDRNMYYDVACVRWFPLPEYPDGDPLWVRINLLGTRFRGPDLLCLREIEPSRVMFELDGDNMNMMRLEGVDVMPED